MTKIQELKIPFSELTVLSIQCKHCGAELTVNLQDDRQRRIRAEGTALLCGVCQTQFPRTLKIALVRLYEWLEDALASEHVVVFRVPHEEQDSKAPSGLSSE